MRLIKITQQHVRAQLSREELARIVKDPQGFRTAKIMLGVPVDLFTYAKAYSRGGGWWDIMGYAYDGSDVEHILTRLEAQN